MNIDKIIKDIRKGASERLRIALRSYKGSSFLDIRCFYDNSGGRESSWLPTRKGIAIQLEFLSELKEAIEKAIEQAELWSVENDTE